MEAVLGILSKAGSISDRVFGVAGKAFEIVGDILTKHSMAIFVLGFFGLLLTFLWFFFRYLDKRELGLPTAVFTLFFLIFLSGNMLLLVKDAEERAEKAGETPVQTVEAESGGEQIPV